MYQLDWTSNNDVVKEVRICVMQLSIGKTYSDKIPYDIVDMDDTHIILGRLW